MEYDRIVVIVGAIEPAIFQPLDKADLDFTVLKMLSWEVTDKNFWNLDSPSDIQGRCVQKPLRLPFSQLSACTEISLDGILPDSLSHLFPRITHGL